MKKYLLGTDVGTTGTKTYLISDDGEVLGSSYMGYETKTPDTLTCLQDAEKLWEAVVYTIKQACAGISDRENIAAISLSTQGGTLIPTDKSFVPLSDAVVWSDGGCADERAEFERNFAPGTLYEKTGWGLGNSLPLLQIRKIRDKSPSLFAKTAYFLTVPDFISARLTGIPAADMSNAGINQLIDVRRGEYDPDLLAFAGIREERLPRLTESCRIIGSLTAEAAETLGLSEKTVLVSGAHDQYAAAVGAGMTEPGGMLIGSGTSWVVTEISDKPDFSAGLAQSRTAVNGRWGSILSLSYGGVCLEWIRKNIAIGEGGDLLPLKTIDRECINARAASDGLFFYPPMAKLSENGENRYRRAAFVGLDVSHDRFDLALAVMEGAAFQIKWMTEAFSGGIPDGALKLTGGAAKSSLWSQMIADVIGKPVIIPEVADMACVGAAITAGIGAGVFADAAEACRRMTTGGKTLLPDPEKAGMYASAYGRYKHNAALVGRMK